MSGTWQAHVEKSNFVIVLNVGVSAVMLTSTLIGWMCRNPVLPEDKLQLYKARQVNGVLHENDAKINVAARKVRELLYGPSSIYARRRTVEGINSVTTSDVRSWLATWQRVCFSLRNGMQIRCLRR
jgi:hypothetical protein